MDKPALSIIFPAYNEAERLPRALHTAVAYLQARTWTFEIIVVDDGSWDRTADVARSALKDSGAEFRVLRIPENHGKGFAVKTGFEAARGRLVIFTDADLSISITGLETMIPLLEQGWDIVIGSKRMPGARHLGSLPWLRKYGGRVFNFMVRILLFPGIKDTQCGFKGFRGDILPELTSRQTLQGFSFDVEILWIARKLGYTIREMPVEWRNDDDSTVSFVKDGLKMFADILKIRFLHRNLKKIVG